MQEITQLLSKVDSNGLVGKLLGGMATKNFAAGLLTGGVAGSVLGGKDAVENIAKVGGLALLGTLAYKAYGNYQQTKQAGGNANVVDSVKQSATDMFAQAKALAASAMSSTQTQATPAPAAPEAQNAELPLAVMRAMIAAAKADGVMDAAETQKIMQNLESAGLSMDEKAIVMQELANNPEIASIASAAKSAEDAAQIYLAALLVCDSQCTNEQAFLANLATALKLDAAFTQALQQQLLAMPSAKAA